MLGPIKVTLIDKQFQLNGSAFTSREGIAQHIEITRYQGKQIARFREGVFPHRDVFIALLVAFDQITV